MSRIGKLPISIPAGVTVTVSPENVVKVKGPKGQLEQAVNGDITVKISEGNVVLERPSDSIPHRSMHGLYRSLIYNMVIGVSKGWEKQLELVGVGYRASNTGQVLELSLGFSHNLVFRLPEEIKVSTKSERNQNPLVILESHDKQLIGLVSNKIRSFRKPEPYKGKGVKFVGEVIRRKAGKSANAK